MSSRRKRAPPVKVDEDRQRQLCWNMHEDRRHEPLLFDEDVQLCLGSGPCAAQDPVCEDSVRGDAAHRNKRLCSEVVSVSEPTQGEETLGVPPPLVKLEIAVSPYHLDNSWKAFLGEWTLQLLPEQSLVEHFSERSLTLMSSESSNQLLVCVHSECGDVEKPVSVCGGGIPVESSLSADLLEDLGWLQKKQRIKLYQRPEGSQLIKVGIYLLEAGLAKLDYLSDANSRMKKFNQLMKRVMEKLYNFIPDALEEEEEGVESEPEGQDIDELYCFVRQAHQQEARPVHVDVQHPALIPVLRPYQREAVSWMLQQERFRSAPASENSLHFLWREIVTCEGLKLYYNPYTGW